MKTTFAVVAGLVAIVSAQDLAPTESAPEGCSTNYEGAFEISAVNTSSVEKRHQKRADCSSDSLAITLKDGVLMDGSGRTGNIVANHQFQFDSPIQSGAIYTSGFSVCSNGSLALGGSAVFYECLSGDFYNLYNAPEGATCSQILIQTSGCTAGDGPGFTGQPAGAAPSTAAVTQVSDGQPQATTSAAQVSQISDGQVQATTEASVSSAPISQISDGQVQASTGAPISQISDGQIQASTAAPSAPISQISDGQVQAPTAATGAPISQISDGQIQATTAASSAAPISQISDGQVQASTAVTGAPISQISDGQVQATTMATALSSAVISQISDGQIQATTQAGATISQISDGQIQATTAAGPAQFTGAANSVQVTGSFAAGFMALIAALL